MDSWEDPERVGLFAGLLRLIWKQPTPVAIPSDWNTPDLSVSSFELLPTPDSDSTITDVTDETTEVVPLRIENSKGIPYFLADWNQHLAEGNYGLVYSCHDSFGQEFILKALKNKRTPEEIVADWQNERELLFALSHPNIVRIFDAFVFENYHYFVMEKADGDLRGYLSFHKKLDPPQVVDIGLQLLSGLAHIHSQNIIHRDLHKDNILYFENSGKKLVVKIADFGISKQLSSEEDFAKSIVGRDWDYSPELVTKKVASKKSDLYQLGLILYYCLTGEAAISSFDGECEQVTTSGLARERANQIGTPLALVIGKLLHLEPEKRYDDCFKAGAALRDSLSTLDWFTQNQ